MSQPDRSKLPIRTPSFGGVTQRTLDGSQPEWEAIGHWHDAARAGATASSLGNTGFRCARDA